MKVWLVIAFTCIAWAALATYARPEPKRTACSLTASMIASASWPFDAKEAARRQGEAARALGVTTQMAIKTSPTTTMALTLIPSGKFVMGSPPGESDKEIRDEEPRHIVTLTRSFYMGTFEVTRAQFAAFVTATGYVTDAEQRGVSNGWSGSSTGLVKGLSWRRSGIDQADDHPVVHVSWFDADEFCKWLSKKSGLTVGLPTEARWEYAARAGTSTVWPWGDKLSDGKGWCNIPDLAAKRKFPKWPVADFDDGYVFTAPVGSYKPNAFGLYDMIGNAAEWCWDCYSEDSYATTTGIDPCGPNIAAESERVGRGGSWGEGWHRSAGRMNSDPHFTSDHVGFRVVVEIPSPASRPTSGAKTELRRKK
jgi:sulfatase modifying factor 1